MILNNFVNFMVRQGRVLENLTAWFYSRTWHLTESRNKTPGAMQLAQSKGWGWPKHALKPLMQIFVWPY